MHSWVLAVVLTARVARLIDLGAVGGSHVHCLFVASFVVASQGCEAGKSAPALCVVTNVKMALVASAVFMPEVSCTSTTIIQHFALVRTAKNISQGLLVSREWAAHGSAVWAWGTRALP